MKVYKAISLAITSLVITLPSLTAQAKSTINPPFIPYADLSINAKWDPQYQDMEPLDLVKLSELSGVKNYTLAFITNAGTGCQPAWAGQDGYSVSKAWASHLTDDMRAKGIHYMVAFGGANGADISSVCTPTQLVGAYEQIIKIYKPDGLDFDIENSQIDVPKLMQAVKEIQTKYPKLKVSFTLPVLPEGLTPAGESVVRLAKENNLKNYLLNIMAMDYGPYYVKNSMGEYAIEAGSNLFSFIKKLYPEKSDAAVWQMVGITPMIGVNDVNVEKFTLADADLLRKFAAHTGVGTISMWSVARDNPCADAWASPVCSGGSLQQVPNEYSKHFLATN
jgi:chitinase